MFTLKIKTDNAVFEDAGPELARILRELAATVEESNNPDEGGGIRDANGNTVGSWTYKRAR